MKRSLSIQQFALILFSPRQINKHSAFVLQEMIFSGELGLLMLIYAASAEHL